MKIQKIFKGSMSMTLILLEIPLATTPLLLFGNNAKAEPINEIILAQSKRCLKPGKREQIQSKIDDL